MTWNERTLNKIIAKAESNGYKAFSLIDKKAIQYIDYEQTWRYKKSPYNIYISLPQVIYSHHFAKCFFGINKIKSILNVKGEADKTFDFEIEIWKSQLQILVLEEFPIDYLAKFL